MRRNFGWMAILATWTIFLILNSGLTGEWLFDNLQINNEYTFYKVHQGSVSSTFDRKAIYDSILRHAKKNFKSNDHLSMNTKAVFLEFKNMENRDLRLSDYEKDDTVANAIATPRYSKDTDSDKNSWLTRKNVATKNTWLLNIIVMGKSRNTKKYNFVSNPHLPSHKSKNTLREKRGKVKTIYAFSNDRKNAAKIRRDTRTFDKKREWHRKKHKGKRMFSGENGESAFFPDEFTKYSRNGSSIGEFKNSDILKLKTIENAELRRTDEKREYNRNDENSRQSLTKNGTDKLMYVNVEANDGSRILETTFPNYSRLKENQNLGNVGTVTDNTLTDNSPYKRSVTVAWTTLIFDSKISNANREVGNKENRVNPYHSPKNEYSKSYKTDEFPVSKTYKRHQYSKIGLKVNTDAREDGKGNVGDIVDSFHLPNSLDSHFAGERSVSFIKDFSLQKEKKMARETPGSRRKYRSFIKNIGARINKKATDLNKLQIRKRTREREIIADANYATRNDLETERDLLSSNLFATGINGAKLEYPTLARISMMRKRNPMHARYVRSNSDCEHPRTTDYQVQVSHAFRFGLWNVSGSSRLAKFSKPLDQKAHSRVRYLRKFDAIDIAAQPPRITKIIDERSKRDGELRRTLTENESISLDATNVGDNPTEMRMINGYAQSSGEPTDESGLENIRIRNRDGNHPDMHEESGFYSRSSGIHNSKYRRYKRHEVRNSLGNPTSTEVDSETWKTFDTIRPTTSNFLIKFTTDPSVSVTQASNMDRISTNANFLTTVKTLPSSGYRQVPREWQSTPSMTVDYELRHTNASAGTDSNGSDSLETMLVDIPKTFNVSSIDASAFLIKTLDRSAIAKIDNSVILKEISSPPEMNLQVFNATNRSLFDVSLIEPINLREIYGMHGNGSIISTIEPFPQRSINSPRNVLEDITTENVNDSSSDDALSEQWPVKHSAVVEGDLVLGGLMMVHEREDTITCGPIMPQGGIQALEAMLYTLDKLNDREIVPGVKIGAHILDDCDKDTYGLEMAVDFIKGSISNIDGAEYHCNKTAVRKVISGVVGAASSVTSIQVANLLRLFRIPQVSFFSTSPELSNKQRFEYFSRTIPSDHYQVKAMVDIVLTMGWSYVSIIYEESNYGIKAFEELEELLGKHNICIAIKEKLVKDSGVAKEIAYDNIILKLLTKPRARGCIIFGSDQEVAGVMRAVRRCNATGAFSWIGSDGWSARGLVSNGNEPEVEGTLSVQPQANPVKGFEEYFLNLTVENNRRNPWFVEFWEDYFKCRYPNASRTPYNKKYTKICTMEERLTKQNTAFEDQLQFVSDAVMAFAYAFRDMHRDLCDGKQGLCDKMKPTKGITLLHYLRKVDFEGLSGDKFRFDRNGDGPARYNIIHFKQIEPGKYKWIRVGKYLEGELRLNLSEIQFKLGHPQPPESVCSLPCELGQAKKYVEGERCCWHCFNCTQYQIRDPKDETQCIQCRQGTLPDETHSICRDIPEEFLRPESAWAISAMSFSATGILVTLFVGGVFLRHNDTPVVRASGRELSYVLLSGILLCYLVTFTLILKPTDIVCGIQRFAAGFCFTVVYAALLTKTNRISRIFNAGSAKRPSFISPRSQLIICFGLIFVQILINGIWIIIDPAKAMHHYPTMEDNLLVCNNYIDASYMIAFAYPTILIVVCTVYAVLTRKIPEAFNESKHIGLTMYTTCVIWCAFIPLYYGTGSNVALRITSMSVTISLSASVTVVCLFSPKLYIILIRPERNVRPTVRAGRPNLTKSSAITATNVSNMMGPVTATTVLTAATCDQNKAIKKHIAIDCSTQSECYELQLKDQKNGESTRTSRSTQTINNEQEFVAVATINKESPDVIASVNNKESKNSTITTKRLNSNARIGNGPLSQNDLSL
ncbi:metabotropic glutamate receptor B isoform X1 [Polyergus mexicanus]|uniref:metabotropic glutamate receptor B isoform X1 n=1 Tax=Polyergus mexicanus TaxID=615972 RepID=UPI0038B43086